MDELANPDERKEFDMCQSPSILVVGGAGYLGCVLVNALLARGYLVTVFDRFFFGDLGLQQVRDRIRVISGDMRSLPHSALQNVNGIINLGGLSNDPTAEYHPLANHEMNTVANRKLAEMAKNAGIRRFGLCILVFHLRRRCRRRT